MANELYTFTGNEVIATELPELLNQNFDYVRENSLKSVNGVEKDENNNVDVTFLTSQVIPTNSDLNNFRESGEYTRELDTTVVANSPTEKPFFLTVLASENLVKQVVTEIDRKDPMTFTRTLSGANWSPWVEGGVDIGIWKSEETVKVGDVRFLKGRENAGYILECVTAGTTGENQPVISEEDVENAEGLDLDDLNGVVPVEKGGTNATTAKEARENLDITPANIGALPLSGGNITGMLTFGDGVSRNAIYKNIYENTDYGSKFTDISYSENVCDLTLSGNRGVALIDFLVNGVLMQGLEVNVTTQETKTFGRRIVTPWDISVQANHNPGEVIYTPPGGTWTGILVYSVGNNDYCSTEGFYVAGGTALLQLPSNIVNCVVLSIRVD